MCSVCGCGQGETRIEGAGPYEHRHDEAQGHGHGPSDAAHGDRLIRLEHDILSKNDGIAAHNRAHFAEARVFVLNLVSSPGAGKTTLLVRTLQHLKDRLPLAVIEGDQETDHDAERIRETGVPAQQVNTGRGCHLDADMVHRALHRLSVPSGGVLFIENVGNLVCPAGFDLGEDHKVCVISTTEGEDKPLKYPGIVAASDLLVISKADLIPHLDFDLSSLTAAALRINPKIEILTLSAKTGEGMAAWYDWIDARLAPAQAAE